MNSPAVINEDANGVRLIAGNPEQSIGECFRKVAKICRSRTAIIGSLWQPSYGELDAVTDGFARLLLEQGSAAGDRVAVLMKHDAPLIAAVLGVLKAGCIAVVLNPSDPPVRIGHVLADAEPTLIFTDALNRELAEQAGGAGQRLICFEDHPQNLQADAPEVQVDPGSVAFLVYTSGSTGKPKGVMRTHRDLLHQVLRFMQGRELDALHRVTLLASLSGGQGVITTWCALLYGAAICPFPVTDIGVSGLAEWMMRHRVTDYRSSASLFRHFMKTLPAAFKFPDVRLVRLGSEPATSADFAKYREHFTDNCIFIHALSSSETGPICQLQLARTDNVKEGRLPVGRPAEGVDLLLLNESGDEVADGETGEITIRSRHLSTGYWRNEELTRQRFSIGGSSGEAKIFRTGDLGRLTPDGQILIVGRADDRVKIRGYRIEVSEIEDALQTQAVVDRAVVMASARENEDLRLVAFVMLRAGSSSSVGELRQALRKMLPRHMVPTNFIFLDNIPLTPHGKIDSARLQGLAKHDIAMPDVEESVTETEELLVGIWKNVFERDDIGRESDFFELGGDSLMAVVVAAKVHVVLQVELNLLAFADHPKLAALAQVIDDLAGHSEQQGLPPLVPVPRDAPLPMSFHQVRIWKSSQSPEGMAGYIMTLHCRLRGRLNVAALRESLTYMVERHEMLRTTFEEISGQPMQLVHLPETVVLTEHDFSHHDQPEEEVTKVRREEAARPMDLKRGPVLRFILSQLREGEYWLQTVHHHLISDGWSWHIFFRELGLIYNSIAQGRTPSLPRTQVLHYGDYAHRQRTALCPGSEAWRKMLAWWRETLSDAPYSYEMPFLRWAQQPDASPDEGRSVREVADASTLGLDQIGREESATFYAVRLAAWSALLAAATAQPDLVLGAYVSDRHNIQTQEMFGFFSNPVALRLRCDEALSFRQWLRDVRRVINETQAQAWLPYDELCEEFLKDGVTPPEFKMIAKVGNRRDPRSLHEVELDWPARVENLVMPWGFTLTFSRKGTGEECQANFNARIYDPVGAGDMLDCFVRLLDVASRRPDDALGTLLAAAGVSRPEAVRAEIEGPPDLFPETRVFDDPLDAIAALKNDPRRVSATVPKQRSSMVAEMSDDCLFQFHHSERTSEKSFRWSQPLCAVKVYPPRHSDRVTLRLHPFVPKNAPPVVILNGCTLTFVCRQGLNLEFQVPAKCIPPHPTWLVIVATPFQSRGNYRSLGLPLHRIKFDTTRVEVA